VVKAEDQDHHDQEVLGSNPHYGDHFSGIIHLDQSLELKFVENSNLALLHMLQMGGWTGWLIKSSYMGQNEL
jgi:hypothetical protein